MAGGGDAGRASGAETPCAQTERAPRRQRGGGGGGPRRDAAACEQLQCALCAGCPRPMACQTGIRGSFPSIPSRFPSIRFIYVFSLRGIGSEC